eukprot:g27924.t1
MFGITWVVRTGLIQDKIAKVARREQSADPEMEEASVSSSSPRKGLLEYKDTAPGEGTLLSVRSPSIQEMDYPLELEEVKKQLSEAQEAASEAQARAKTVEEQRAKEAQEQHARKERTRKLLEDRPRDATDDTRLGDGGEPPTEHNCEKLSATRRGVKPTTNVPELAEVKRQLSEAQELATEAQARAKIAEEKMAREAQEQQERKAAAEKLLEEPRRAAESGRLAAFGWNAEAASPPSGDQIRNTPMPLRPGILNEHCFHSVT